jgi:hypothetical protein
MTPKLGERGAGRTPQSPQPAQLRTVAQVIQQAADIEVAQSCDTAGGPRTNSSKRPAIEPYGQPAVDSSLVFRS